MSDVRPFEEAGGSKLPVLPETSDVDPFKPELAGVDWGAYEEREAILDAVAVDPFRTHSTIAELQQQDPVVGVMLNNMHNREIQGEPINRLPARLAVLTRSLVRVDLPGLDFGGGVAVETDFTDRNLRGANFTDSVMPRVKFSGADLSGTSFVNAVLNGADFTGAKLNGVDFAGAYLVNVAGLTAEQLRNVNLDGARFIVPSSETREDKDLASALSTHFGEMAPEDMVGRLDPVPIARGGAEVAKLQTNKLFRGLCGVDLVLSDVDFTRSKLDGLTLHNAVARRIVLRAAKMSGGTILKSQFDNADLHSLWAPGTLWESVSLRGANVTNGNFAGSVFRGVDLSGVVGLDAKDTNLEGVVIEDCLLPTGYRYENRKLIVPELNLPELPEDFDTER